MRKLERDRRRELERWFTSDVSARKAAGRMGVSAASVLNAWGRMYGKCAVSERGTRMRALNGRHNLEPVRTVLDEEQKNRITECFHCDDTIQTVAAREQVDERTIRRLWRGRFGDEAVVARRKRMRANGAAHGKHRIPQKRIEQVVAKLHAVPNICVVAGEFGLSRSFVRNLACSMDDLRRLVSADGSARRSATMRKMRSDDALTEQEKDKVVELAGTGSTTREIAATVGIGISSVGNILKERLSPADHAQRVAEMRGLGKRKAMESLIRAGKIGSRPENEFHGLLRLALATEVKHHDLDLLPPFEIDVTLPMLKIAIMWDGVGHFRPIFGKKSLMIVQARDRYKRRKLGISGWTVFTVHDLENRFRTAFLEKQALRLFRLLEKLGHADIIRHF